jgi:hypothetical protein
MTRGPLDKTLLCISILAMAAGLSGCVGGDPFNAPIDKSSPVASRVAAISAQSGPYPHWSDFPAQPMNVPTPADIAARTATAQGAQAAILDHAGGLHWTLTAANTAAFLAETRATIDPALAKPAPAGSEAEIEAWAKAQRDLATPPPKAR